MAAAALFTVLVATDFSPTAETAVEWGSELARARAGRVVVVHALEQHGLLADFLPASTELDERLQETAEARLAKLAAALGERGLTVETRLPSGPASQAIAHLAGELVPDLVVQGSRGINPRLAERLLGSTARRVVQHCPRPVLTVHPGDRERHAVVRHVLVPTDFSLDAAAAAQLSRALLGVGEGARLTLLHAYHLPVEYTAYGTIPTAIPFYADVAAVAETKLAEAAAAFAGSGVAVETLAREGYPPEVITAAAAELDADLIAMGTHGRTGLRHLLLGSTAERVVETAPCPVLTVRQAEG